MTDKAEARRAAMARRKAAHAAGADLTAPLLAAIGTGEGPVAGYLPIRSEADPTPAMTPACWTSGLTPRARRSRPNCSGDASIIAWPSPAPTGA